MHPALHRARAHLQNQVCQCILDHRGIATVVLRLVNGLTVSLGGHYSTDYYDHSAPCVTLAKQPAYPSLGREPTLRFRRSSRSNLPTDSGLLQILFLGNAKLKTYPRALRRTRVPATRNQNHKSQAELEAITLLIRSSHTPLSFPRCVVGKDLGFDNYRLTISVSVACSYWK